MQEMTLLYQITGAGTALILSSFFYSWGGRAGGPGKWIRRYLASFILAATVNVLFVIRGHWSPWFLAIYPCLVLGFVMGYGADSLGMKLLRRSLSAAAILSSGLLIAIVLGGAAWAVFIPHVIVGAGSIYLGTRNPLPAAVEEFMVCMVLNLFLITYAFVG